MNDTNHKDSIAGALRSKILKGLTTQISGVLRVKGWTKQDLARASGIPQSTLSAIMSDKDTGRDWNFNLLPKVAIALDMGVYELVRLAEIGGELSPLQILLSGTQPRSRERLDIIIRQVAPPGTAQEVLDLYFTSAMMEMSAPELVKRYLDGEIDDSDVFNALRCAYDELEEGENFWVKVSQNKEMIG